MGNIDGMSVPSITVALNLFLNRTQLNLDFWSFVNFAIHKCPYYGIGGGNSESAPLEIGAGPRFLKLPPLLAAAAAEISYSNTFQECSRMLVLSPLLGFPVFSPETENWTTLTSFVQNQNYPNL